MKTPPSTKPKSRNTLPKLIREANSLYDKMHIASGGAELENIFKNLTPLEQLAKKIFEGAHFSNHKKENPNVRLDIPSRSELKREFANLCFDYIWNNEPDKFNELAKAMRELKWILPGIAIGNRKLAKDGIAFLPERFTASIDVCRLLYLKMPNREKAKPREIEAY